MSLTTYLAIFGAGFIGSLVGHLVTLLVKREGFSREDRARWLNHREDAYSQFLGAVARVLQVSLAKREEPLDDAWRSEIDGLQLTLGRVRLLASDVVADAGEDLYQATMREAAATSHAKVDVYDKKRPSILQFKQARDLFQDAARVELNIAPKKKVALGRSCSLPSLSDGKSPKTD